MSELTLRPLLDWEIITEAEYLERLFPLPKYTCEDCRDWNPAELGF